MKRYALYARVSTSKGEARISERTQKRELAKNLPYGYKYIVVQDESRLVRNLFKKNAA